LFHQNRDMSIEQIDKIIDKYANEKHILLQLLLDIQHEFNWVPQEAVLEMNKKLKIPIGEVIGAIIDSEGQIVMDKDTCMVELARSFVNFFCDESCGKCLPCREGLKQERKILANIVSGKGKEGDIEKLRQIAEASNASSLCALGQTSANSMLTTLRYCADEYEAHIKEKRCPALFCKSLVNFYIDQTKCTACAMCLRNCQVQAIDGSVGKIPVIDQSKCIKCGSCLDACEFKAISKISGKQSLKTISEE
jgi:ferredoxin